MIKENRLIYQQTSPEAPMSENVDALGFQNNESMDPAFLGEEEAGNIAEEAKERAEKSRDQFALPDNLELTIGRDNKRINETDKAELDAMKNDEKGSEHEMEPMKIVAKPLSKQEQAKADMERIMGKQKSEGAKFAVEMAYNPKYVPAIKDLIAEYRDPKTDRGTMSLWEYVHDKMTKQVADYSKEYGERLSAIAMGEKKEQMPTMEESIPSDRRTAYGTYDIPEPSV